MADSTSPAQPRQGRWRRRILCTLLVLVLLVGITVALAPMIASRLGPGMVQSNVNKQIPGKVTVSKLDLSWSGPTVVGPIELLDETGKSVGTFSVDAAPGVWRVLKEGWWKVQTLNVGEVRLSGKLDVVRGTDGRTNIERALGLNVPGAAKPATPPSKPPTAGGGGGPQQVRAALKIDKLDLTFVDQSAPAGSPTAQGVNLKSFGGEVNIDYRAGAGGAAVVQSALAGALSYGSAASTSQQKIVLDLNAKMNAAGKLGDATLKLDVTNVPTALLDVLAGLGGELAAAIGPSVDLKVTGAGTLDKATADLVLTAQGAGADLAFAYDGSILWATKPGRIWTRSTGFLAGLPAARAQSQQLASTIKLDAPPGLEITLDSLRVPLPKAALSGGGDLMKTLDLRAASAMAKVKIDGMTGKIAIDELTGAGGAAAAGSANPAAWKPFKVEPLVFALNAPDLSKGADLTASTNATIGPDPAGKLMIDAHAGGLLDAGGHLLAGMPRDLRADVSLDGASTALLQPVVAATGLPLQLKDDLGPRLDLALRVAASGTATADLPPTNVDATIASDNLSFAAALTLDNNVVSTREAGITAKVRAAGPLARRILAQNGPPTLDLQGPVALDLKITDVAAPINNLSNPGNLAARVALTINNLSVRPAPAEGKPPVSPITLSGALASITLPGKGAGPYAGLNGAFAHEGHTFTAEGGLALPDLFKTWPMPKATTIPEQVRMANAWKPSGKVEIKGIPGSLASLTGASSTGASADDVSAQITQLVWKLLGSGSDVTVNIAPLGTGADAKTSVTAVAKGASIALDAGAEIGPADVAVKSLTAQATVTPDAAAGLLRALSAKPDPKATTPALAPMALQGPASLRLALDPIRVPWSAPGAASPLDLAKAGDVKATVAVADQLILTNLPLTEAGAVAGVRALTATVSAPAGALAASGGTPAPIKATLTGDLIDGGKQSLATIRADVNAPMSAATADVAASITAVKTALLDTLLAKKGALPGALGDTAEINLKAHYAKTGTTTAEATVQSPRLKSKSPIKFSSDATKIALTSGAVLDWTPDVAWLNAQAFPPVAGATGPQARLDPQQPIAINLNIEKFVLATASAAGVQPVVGPLKPGVFDLGGVLTSPKIRIYSGLVGPDGKERPPLEITGVRASAWLPKDVPGAIAANLTADKVEGPDGTGEAGAKTAMSATITKLADAAGVVRSDQAVLDAFADIKAFPTPVVDFLANQHGLLNEALGPVISLNAEAKGASANSGMIRAQAASPRATAKLGGRIQNGSFVQSEPVELRLTQITPNLMKQLAGSIPVIGTLEKTDKDEPAVITTQGLNLPLDNDLRKLSGTVSISPGVAHFTTTGPFQKIIKFAGAKEAGVIGRRLEPFVVRMTEGKLNYDRFKLPLGEFDVETKGQVDLVGRSIDLVTYVPFFALTDDAAGALNGNIAGQLGKILPGGIDRLTMVPIRTRGSLDNPKTEIDGEMFFQNFGESLLKAPGNIIDDITKGKLDEIFKKKKDK